LPGERGRQMVGQADLDRWRHGDGVLVSESFGDVSGQHHDLVGQ